LGTKAGVAAPSKKVAVFDFNADGAAADFPVTGDVTRSGELDEGVARVVAELAGFGRTRLLRRRRRALAAHGRRGR
jgi:hypothetical protein